MLIFIVKLLWGFKLWKPQIWINLEFIFSLLINGTECFILSKCLVYGMLLKKKKKKKILSKSYTGASSQKILCIKSLFVFISEPSDINVGWFLLMYNKCVCARVQEKMLNAARTFSNYDEH